MKKILTLLLLVIALPVLAQETRYVTDEFEITMRTGQGTQHKILKTLASGTRLELIETSEEGYAHVKTSDGTEGWVLSRYLINQPVAKERLAVAEQKISRQEKQLSTLKTEHSQLQKQHDSLRKQFNELSKEKNNVDSELKKIKSISTKELTLFKENETLTKKTSELQTQVETLQRENSHLKDSSNKEWFIIGSVVCVVGIILGLIIPRLRRRSGGSWGSL